MAVEGDFPTILSVLLENGADPDIVDEEGNNCRCGWEGGEECGSGWEGGESVGGVGGWRKVWMCGWEGGKVWLQFEV